MIRIRRGLAQFNAVITPPSPQKNYNNVLPRLNALGNKEGLLISGNFNTIMLSNREYSVGREAKFLKKLVTGTRHTRKKWFVGEHSSQAFKDLSFMMNGPSSDSSSRKSKGMPGRTIRRVGVLSTVFMESITSLLATGEASTDIIGLGLEITQVKISSDFKCVNVYWYGSGTANDDELEVALKGIAGNLRHTLSQLRVIGQVPPIVFVKDKKHARLAEIEYLLSKADFGEDYTPTALGHNFKISMTSQHYTPSLKSSWSVSPQLSKDLESLELETNNHISEEKGEEETPSETDMRQNMLGLDWGKVMEKITKEVSRARQRQLRVSDFSNTVLNVQSLRSNSEILEEVTRNVNRQKEFLQFLKLRRIQRSREEKRQSTLTKEKEFLEEEKRLRCVEVKGFNFPEPPEQEDYFDDQQELQEDWRHQESSREN